MNDSNEGQNTPEESNALVPYSREPTIEQKKIIEEMESVLYSISFGKQKIEKN